MQVRERIGRFKYTKESDIAEEYSSVQAALATEIATLTQDKED